MNVTLISSAEFTRGILVPPVNIRWEGPAFIVYFSSKIMFRDNVRNNGTCSVAAWCIEEVGARWNAICKATRVALKSRCGVTWCVRAIALPNEEAWIADQMTSESQLQYNAILQENHDGKNLGFFAKCFALDSSSKVDKKYDSYCPENSGLTALIFRTITIHKRFW